MLSAGIDLAADPKKTGVARIMWNGDNAAVTALSVGSHTDEDLCDLVKEADKTGVDCPLGWPSAFVDYLVAHQEGGRALSVPETRRSLSYRVTDLHIIERIGLRPLSVSADRIGATAMRCAAILSMLTNQGVAIDRSGQQGPVVEVYPAAALKIWGLPHRGYKGRDAQRRVTLVEAIESAFPCLDLGGFAALCLKTDDALDAVLCALIAGLVARGAAQPLPAEAHAAAETEGWIALPLPR